MPLNADVVIFDIDNVLIDTRHSYLDTIRWTIEIFLTHGDVPYFVNNLKKNTPFLAAHDVDRFKLLGGFNDDWDCCYGILIYLLSLPVQKRLLSEIKKKIDIPALAKSFSARPVGVNGLVKRFGRPSTITIEKISRIFQEIYLGKELFMKVENRRPLYWTKRGLVYKERLIFKKSLLEKMKSLGLKLGIATGRPKFEAVFGLHRFGILPLFEAMTTADDVRKAEDEQKCSLRKPHSFSLIETARYFGQGKRCFYVGDLPDDVLAARSAKKNLPIESVAFPAFTSDPHTTAEELKKVKPDFLVQRPSELLRVLTIRNYEKLRCKN